MKAIKYNKIPEKVYYEKLKSGLEVYMYPNKKVRNFYITYNIKAGSTILDYQIDKKKYKLKPGTMHFLEHKMFEEENGTAFDYFAKLGSSVNAYTTSDNTTYEVISNNHFKENLEILYNFISNPVFKETSVNKEKDIIKEEIEMYENDIDSKIIFETEKMLNINDNHKHKVSGETEDIKKITKDDLYNAYDAFYNKENSFIVITGNFNYLEAIGILKELERDYKVKPYTKPIIKKEKEPIKVKEERKALTKNISIPKIMLTYKLDKNKFKADNNLNIYLDAILDINFSDTSDFLELITNENLIVGDLNYNTEIRDNYIYISFTFDTFYENEVIELIENKLNNIVIKKEDLNMIKRGYKADFIRSFDDIIAINENIANDIYASGEIKSNIYDIYDKLTINKINEITKKINTKVKTICVIN